MKQIPAITIWQTILKDTEITIKRSRFGNEYSRLQWKLKRRDTKAVDEPRLVILKGTEAIVRGQ